MLLLPITVLLLAEKQTYVKRWCFSDSAKKLVLKCPGCPRTMEHNTKRQHKAQHARTIRKRYEKVMHVTVIIIAALQKCRDFTLSEAGGAGDAQTQPSQAALHCGLCHTGETVKMWAKQRNVCAMQQQQRNQNDPAVKMPLEKSKLRGLTWQKQKKIRVLLVRRISTDWVLELRYHLIVSTLKTPSISWVRFFVVFFPLAHKIVKINAFPFHPHL